MRSDCGAIESLLLWVSESETLRFFVSEINRFYRRTNQSVHINGSAASITRIRNE